MTLRKEVVEQALLQAARKDAEEAMVRVKVVYGEYRSVLPGRDAEALYHRAYGYLPEKLEELLRWTRETSAFTAKALREIVEAKELARKREEELASLVEHLGSSDRAEFIFDLAKELVASVGASETHRRLSEEFTARYGRARRQKMLTSIMTGEKGQRFLAFHQARVVDLVLEGVILWLEYKYKLQPIAGMATGKTPVPEQKTPMSSGGLTSLGDAFAKLKL